MRLIAAYISSYSCHRPYISTRYGVASIPVTRRVSATVFVPLDPHDFNCTSSYGPEKANKGINPTPDTATRGPEACRPPRSQIGIKRTSSYSFCWIWCSSASRFLRSRSLACWIYQASISGSFIHDCAPLLVTKASRRVAALPKAPLPCSARVLYVFLGWAGGPGGG